MIEAFANKHPEARVLLCSGHVPEELDARGLLAGRHARLPKPFTSDELFAAVSRLFVRAG